MDPDRSFDLTATFILDRVMPAPVALSCLAAVVTSSRPFWTILASFTFIMANLLTNAVIAERWAQGHNVEFLRAPTRIAISATCLPLLVLSAGPGSMGWVPAIPAVLVLPFFCPGMQVVLPVAAVAGTLVPAMAYAGYPTAELAMTMCVLAVVVILASPLISAIRDSYSEMQLARREAQSAARAKDQFLASMSHELRTPLTAILGFAEALQEPELEPAERSEYVATIRRSGQHLLQLINDVLDFTRLDTVDLPLILRTVDPRPLVLEVQTLLTHQAVERDNRLEVELATPVPIRLQIDPLRVKQILVNLVGNAVKFTERGVVRIVLREESGMLRFEVHDTGTGIEAEALETVFEAFVQVGDVRSQRKGTGLGLALARRLAERMGGRLTAQSQLHVGSVFVLSLPVTTHEVPRAAAWPGQDAVAPSASPVRCSQARILVAEDGKDNQVLLAFFLEKAGCEVTMVDDGRSAVEAALAESFDLVLMDISMPILDGDEATRELRARGYEGPIVALTAHALPDVRERCMLAGANDYVTKPIHRETLLGVVATYCDGPD